MQHPRLRKTDIQTTFGAGDRNVHQATFFFDAAFFLLRIFVREQTFFQTRDKHGIELQSLGGMHRHQLQGVLPSLGLIVARFQRGMGQEGRQGRHHGRQWRIGIQHFHAILRRNRGTRHLFATWPKHGGRIVTKTFFGNEQRRRTDQLLQILYPVCAFLFILVMRDQAARIQHDLHHFRQRQMLGFETSTFDQLDESTQRRPRLTSHIRHRRAQ